MSLTGKKTVLAVGSNNRVQACVVYVKNDKGIFGAYYGYSGGGEYEDGYFFISKKEKVISGSDTSLFSKFAIKLCEELSSSVNDLLDHDDHEGGVSDIGTSLRKKGNVYVSSSGWEHRSSGVTQKLLRTISADWGLSFRWK
jgi:hypothetical protein